MNDIHSPGNLRKANTVRLSSTLRVLLVCWAVSGYVAALPVQQAAEEPGPPSKTGMHSEHHHSTASASPGETAGAQKAKSDIKITIPDLEVVDQSGKKLRFYTDLVKGKVVVINFIYTTCTYVCPMQGNTFPNFRRRSGIESAKKSILFRSAPTPSQIRWKG